MNPLWEILGPFQIGTREAAWGADPLEFHGGFHALTFDPAARFKSSLAPNGTVKWNKRSFGQHPPSTWPTTLVFDFPEIDWPALQSVYGWPNLQWQAWARSSFVITAQQTQSFLFDLTGALEFWIDDVRYWGGDYYELRRAPLALHLTPGRHQIDVRLVCDVRSMGATTNPRVPVNIRLRYVSGQTGLVPSNLLLPDIADGHQLVSKFGSVTLTNVWREAVQVLGITSATDSADVHALTTGQTTILPGQSRPVAFKIALKESSRFGINISYSSSDGKEDDFNFYSDLKRRRKEEPQKITYEHPGGIISYAMLRPPILKSTCAATSGTSFPILLYLHGSGVEADSDLVTGSLDNTKELPAWTLFATGVTSWCGDDWHNWAWRDVEAAIEAIPTWIESTGWSGPSVNTSRWLVTGHSNGGQGVWYAVAHQSDKVIAAAPASGYLSIQAYVPYFLWAETDPARSALVQSALNSYRHELLVPTNSQGIPLAIQHGSADDNVPVYHARRMYELLKSNDRDVYYNEVPDAGHVFDGMMETRFLTSFFTEHLTKKLPDTVPERFALASASPIDTGPKYGVRIEELQTPGRLGKILVEQRNGEVVMKTSNVRQISIKGDLYQNKRLTVDDQELGPMGLSPPELINVVRSSRGWKIGLEGKKKSIPGGLDAFLRTRGRYSIIEHGEGVQDIALQISRNLLQYLGADSAVISPGSSEEDDEGNAVVLGIGPSVPGARAFDFPIKTEKDRIQFTINGGEMVEYQADERGLGAIYLRPGEHDTLELVVWGTDMGSLSMAARLMPMMTGTGQPDFIVANREMMWKGLDGTLALGFFNARWQISSGASFFD